ncbi:iron chaperone [Flavobacterium sp.]|uniref:iron chaperone n=1 Tax=Flavobacterium sp. TaxID=239 RepID=UPI0035AE2F11
MAKTKPNDTEGVNKYISNLPVEQQIALERVRQIIKNTVPEAQEYLSYKMPAYHFHGMIGGFAAFKNHCSFFPWDSKTIDVFKDELTSFKTSAGTIQFTPEKPLSEELLQKILRYRVASNLEKEKK